MHLIDLIVKILESKITLVILVGIVVIIVIVFQCTGGPQAFLYYNKKLNRNRERNKKEEK